MNRARFHTRWLVPAALMAAVLPLGGCFGIWGAHGKPYTAKTHSDTELVPNAVLAKENTAAVWALGRYAFVPGEDRLLVLTHFTAWPDKREADKAEDGAASAALVYKDRRAERVWITIPAGTKVGQELKLDELESNFLVGYDAGDIDGPFYAQPNKVLGSVILKEDDGQHVVIDIDVVVEPQRMESWRVVQIAEVPVTETGIHATKAANLDRATIVGRKQRHLEVPPTASGLAPTTQPVSNGVAATVAENRLGERLVVGKWEAVGSNYTARLQLKADNRFALALSKAGGQEPEVVQKGSYQVRGEYLMLRGDKALGEGAGQGANMQSLRAKWSGDQLVLAGALVPGVTEELNFSAGKYNDLSTDFTQAPAAETK